MWSVVVVSLSIQTRSQYIVSACVCVQEPIVKEPLPTSNVSSRPSSSFFADAASTTTTTSSSSNGTGTASTHPPGGETSGSEWRFETG